ncbi:hypothetical protein [Dysgonomonas sp. GY617]|uniref:hypothetical protein n=1 Tax=Dysgonomonas sp. GY617 TaxID=2780420 RepID=UPI0018848AA2|nr:hypothetical protein [Dysgonomonas sp. GY617]MBF0574797.1 hypothetical protein [Dysgonomonas sp. GY617]
MTRDNLFYKIGQVLSQENALLLYSVSTNLNMVFIVSSNMTKIQICLLLFLIPLMGYSQKNILSDMQGLSLNGDMIFELDGYIMTIQKEKAAFNEKGFQKIKKKYHLNDIEREYSDKNVKWENWVIEANTTVKGVPEAKGFQLCYLLPETDNRMMVVLLQSANGRDSLVEKAFMNAVFSRQLSQYTMDSWVAEKIDFAGREIMLGDVCQWVSPHNVHCASFGQMGWSIFKTEKEAELNTLIQIANNNNSGRYKIMHEEELNVIFEGIPTLAKRITYKINTSKLMSGGRNVLAVYYITQKVRGKYLSCVLTHYVEVKDNYSLPILLKEVMSIPT